MLRLALRHAAPQRTMVGMMAQPVMRTPMLAATQMKKFETQNALMFQRNGVRHAGAGAIGAGLAMTGAGGAAAGMGSVFGGYVQGLARNPSEQGTLFAQTMIGFALVELVFFACVGMAGFLAVSD